MSNIIKARTLLANVLEQGDLDRLSRRRIGLAIALMHREPPIRRVKARKMPITAHMRKEIRRLAETSMSVHDIADKVGLRNSGRVSEVLNGKR